MLEMVLECNKKRDSFASNIIGNEKKNKKKFLITPLGCQGTRCFANSFP